MQNSTTSFRSIEKLATQAKVIFVCYLTNCSFLRFYIGFITQGWMFAAQFELVLKPPYEGGHPTSYCNLELMLKVLLY